MVDTYVYYVSPVGVIGVLICCCIACARGCRDDKPGEVIYIEEPGADPRYVDGRPYVQTGTVVDHDGRNIPQLPGYGLGYDNTMAYTGNDANAMQYPGNVPQPNVWHTGNNPDVHQAVYNGAGSDPPPIYSAVRESGKGPYNIDSMGRII